MPKTFRSLKAFSNHLITNVVNKYERREQNLLKIVGRFIEKESKEIIGHRQSGVGDGYGAWPDLAEATKVEKERLGDGSGANEWQPLLRTGEMRDSISFSVAQHKVYIGAMSDIMIYQEKGTARIPPRPVLGLAMYKEKVKMRFAIGNFMFAWITDIRAMGKIT